LCDPRLCPDAPDDGGRCDHCPLDWLEAAEQSASGQLLRRALDLRAALKLGFQIGLDEILADEFQALLIVDDELSRWESERANGGTGAGANQP
jgi:hypothetical protein